LFGSITKNIFIHIILFTNVQYYCFQSAEIKESGGRFSDNYYKCNRELINRSNTFLLAFLFDKWLAAKQLRNIANGMKYLVIPTTQINRSIY